MSEIRITHSFEIECGEHGDEYCGDCRFLNVMTAAVPAGLEMGLCTAFENVAKHNRARLYLRCPECIAASEPVGIGDDGNG